MRDLFLDDRGLDMTRAGDPMMKNGLGAARGGGAGAAFDAASLGQAGGSGLGLDPAGRHLLPGRHVCPFCGSVNESADAPCPRCTMENNADTRKATKSRIGPWYVLQSRNPAAPGMRYETLIGFVRKGRVKARSIVRGPTTHQLWRFACQVRGLSREFGVCYSCGGGIDRPARVCPQCNRPQDPPTDPDVFLEGQAHAPAPAAPGTITMTAVAEPQPPPPAAAPSRSEPAPARPPVFKELIVPTASDDVAPPVGPTLAAAAPAPIAPAPPITPAPLPPQNSEAQAVRQPSAPAPAPAPTAAPTPGGDETDAVTKTAGQRKAGDVLISAKELAAAFQLHFDADADDTPSAVRGGAATVGLGGSGADAPLPWPPRRRRKRRWGRAVLVLLLLAVAGFAAYLAVNAEFRRRTFEWAQARYAALTGADLYPDLARPRPDPAPAVRPRATTNPTPAPVAAGSASAAPRPEAPSAAVTLPSAARVPQADDVPAQDRTLPAARAAEPKDEEAPPVSPDAPPSVPEPTPQVPVDAPRQPAPPRQEPTFAPEPAAEARPMPPAPLPAPATRPVVVASTRPAAPADPAPGRAATAAPARPQLTPQEAQRRSRLWYSQALDADARGDVAAARDLYKKIMDELPREVWYSDVEVRYRQARKALGE